MGMYFISCGVLVDLKELDKTYMTRTKERSHKEERFDPKTGKSIGKVKVVDADSEEYWELWGQRFDDPFEILDEILEWAQNKRLKFKISWLYSEEHNGYIIYPQKLKMRDNTNLSELFKFQDQFTQIKNVLEDVKLNPSGPIVALLYS